MATPKTRPRMAPIAAERLGLGLIGTPEATAGMATEKSPPLFCVVATRIWSCW